MTNKNALNSYISEYYILHNDYTKLNNKDCDNIHCKSATGNYGEEWDERDWGTSEMNETGELGGRVRWRRLGNEGEEWNEGD